MGETGLHAPLSGFGAFFLNDIEKKDTQESQACEMYTPGRNPAYPGQGHSV